MSPSALLPLPLSRQTSQYFLNLRVFLFTLWMLTAGMMSAQAVVYDQRFDETVAGQTPEDFLVLGGRFKVQDQMLMLPGAPLDNHGAVFGPDNEGDLEIRARIRSEKKGRLYPSFGVGLYGLGGYSLKVSPAKKSLELYKGRQMVAEAPFQWMSSSGFTCTEVTGLIFSMDDSRQGLDGGCEAFCLADPSGCHRPRLRAAKFVGAAFLVAHWS